MLIVALTILSFKLKSEEKEKSTNYFLAFYKMLFKVLFEITDQDED